MGSNQEYWCVAVLKLYLFSDFLELLLILFLILLNFSTTSLDNFRLNDGAMSGSSLRSLELWSSCEADGVKLTQQNFVSLVQTTEDAFNANIRDICHMAHGLDQGMIDTLKDIRGHDSVAALRVGKSDGSR